MRHLKTLPAALPLLFTGVFAIAPLALYDGCLASPSCSERSSPCLNLTNTVITKPVTFEKTISSSSCNADTDLELLGISFNGAFAQEAAYAEAPELQGDVLFEFSLSIGLTGDTTRKSVNQTLVLSNLFPNKKIMVGNFMDSAANASFQGIGSYDVTMAATVVAKPRVDTDVFSIDIETPVISQVCVPKQTYEKVIANMKASDLFYYVDTLASCSALSTQKIAKTRLVLAAKPDAACDLGKDSTQSSFSVKGSKEAPPVTAGYIMYASMSNPNEPGIPHRMPLGSCLAIADGERTKSIKDCANNKSLETIFTIQGETETELVGQAFEGKLTDVKCSKPESGSDTKAPVPTAFGHILATVSAVSLVGATALLNF